MGCQSYNHRLAQLPGNFRIDLTMLIYRVLIISFRKEKGEGEGKEERKEEEQAEHRNLYVLCGKADFFLALIAGGIDHVFHMRGMIDSNGFNSGFT